MAKTTGIKANPLKRQRIAVLGFGSQGRAQALNLRDSGLDPIIGLPSGSHSRKSAKKEKFHVIDSRRAIALSNIIVVLIPDHKHKEFFDKIPGPVLSRKTLVFAHGLSVGFGLVKPPSDCDIIMVAPHGPGVRIRERYKNNEPFTAFAAVEQNHSKRAWQTARAYAAAIGCPKGNLFKSTFFDEAVGDIFGEQAVLCGGLTGLLEAGFGTLVKKGHSPESAYLECVYQLDLIIDLVKRFGPAGMFKRISKTAAFGSLTMKDDLIIRPLSGKMDQLYREIKSGKFAQSLVRENKKDMSRLDNLLKKISKSDLQKAHDRLVRKVNVRSRRRTAK